MLQMQKDSTQSTGNKVAAIIMAAGRGNRMGGSGNKVFIPLAGVPVLVHTLRAFADSGYVDRLILVTSADETAMAADMVEGAAIRIPLSYAVGGQERQSSVWNGLQKLAGDEEIVLIHDGARPFVAKAVIRNCMEAARLCGAACIGVPVKDTIKRVDDLQQVVETPDRHHLWQVQTPQGFSPKLILEAHRRAREEGFMGTDDAGLVERMGHPVQMVMGQDKNLKLTTPEDLVFARVLAGESLH